MQRHDSKSRLDNHSIQGSLGAINNWTIDNSGSKVDGSVSNNPDSTILIRFRDVIAVAEGTNQDFGDVDIDFNLIGKLHGMDENVVIKFLPEPGETSVFFLKDFNFFGSGNKGGACRSGIRSLLSDSELTITATELQP